MALAVISQGEKLGMGFVDPKNAVPDCRIPARNGGFFGNLWKAFATDNAPTLSPWRGGMKPLQI